MSVDISLRIKASLTRHRNVLKRAERIARLKELDKWTEQSSALGLPKVANRKLAAGKKKAKEEAAAGEAGAAAGGAAPAAAAGAPAGAAKPEKPKK